MYIELYLIVNYTVGDWTNQTFIQTEQVQICQAMCNYEGIRRLEIQMKH